jgi:hypothetical protein
MADETADSLRYTVRRFNWRWAGQCFLRAPGEARIAWFDTPDEAEADCRRREREVRGRVNPFQCGLMLHYLTTFPEPVFLDYLLDLGLTPPDPQPDGRRKWVEWWDAGKEERTADQTAQVWEALNRVRFFDVIARHPSEVVYTVVQVLWDCNGGWYDPGDEGGQPIRAFRSRAKAEAHRQQLEAAARAQFSATGEKTWWVGLRRWELSEWPHPAPDAGSEPPIEDVPFYEVVEIDWVNEG